jgi:heptosyltransferase-1
MLISFPSSPQRILIIKPSAIGDVVHALPILNLLRKRWPAAHISWLVATTCAGLLDGHPMLDEIIRFDRRSFGTAWRDPSAAKGLFGFASDLRRKNFDLVIDLQGLFRSGWMAWKTRAPVRVGFANAREFAPLFYTHRVAIETQEQHAIDRYLRVAAALGCESSPVEFPLATSEQDRRRVSEWLAHGEHFAVLLPGTNWPTKRWPVERFAAMAPALRDRFGLKTVVAGGPDDVEIASKIPADVNLAGQTSLGELTALLERADLVIANDSGPMHIAAALGRPLVTVFGPTNPVRTGPYGRGDCVVQLNLPCSPCYSRTCSHQSCLRWLEIEPVLAEAERQMNRLTR